MSVTTPITQAIDDGQLSRKQLRALMRRSDALPALHLGLWLILVGASGFVVASAMGSIWLWPAMFVHGVILVHHFSLQHECTHYTVFNTRRLNVWVSWMCGLVIMLAPKYFRYEHCDHHTWTQQTGRDPEQIPLPKTIWAYLWYLSSVPYWQAKFSEVGRHALGRMSAQDRAFVPESEYASIFLEARVLVAVYAIVIATMILFEWSAPLYLWIIPVVLGEPVMRYIRMTEHVGMPPVADMRRNTRTNQVWAPLQWLCWNMNYHAEHHYASSVPYHALPQMHRLLQGYLPSQVGGYAGAHRDMLAQLGGAKPRCDEGL